jgi:multiple sugar transport system ATP-binding protein
VDAQTRIEIGQGLIHQKGVRLAHDGAAHRDALALAAGKLRRLSAEIVRQFEDLRRRFHFGGDEVERRIQWAGKLLQIEALMDRKPAQLSGGQRQRVAMGRALVRDPLLFLFDEPLSNLDAKLRVDMRTEIKKLHLRVGKTTIYVTHDQIEAMTMGDRVAVMNHGVLQQLAAPRVLYHEPANLFVASFIGSPAINLIEGRIVSGDNGLELSLGNERLRLPETLLGRKPALPSYAGRSVAVGVRAEALAVGGVVGPSRGTIGGTVVFAEDLGASLLVHLDVDAPPPRLDGTDIAVEDDVTDLGHHTNRGRVRALVDGFAAIKPGDRLPIAIDLDRVHLFDRRTGLAIGGGSRAQ